MPLSLHAARSDRKKFAKKNLPEWFCDFRKVPNYAHSFAMLRVIYASFLIRRWRGGR